MDSHLQELYKRQYSLNQSIDDKSGKNKYEADKLAFKNYCIAIIQDINRILNECKLNKDRYYILSNIFNTSNNNDDILLKIKVFLNNDKEKYFLLKGHLEEYLQITPIKNNLINLN